jgi:hypothetical protein
MGTAAPLPESRYEYADRVADEITELCGYIYAATYQLLVKIREFDQNQLWAGAGVCSCAHWLNFRCGIGMNAAREPREGAGCQCPGRSASYQCRVRKR